jgi:hypothetical protein
LADGGMIAEVTVHQGGFLEVFSGAVGIVGDEFE